MPNIPVTLEIKNLLDSDNLAQSKDALDALGAAVWNFVGAYSGGTPYAVGDVVTYQGQTWYRLNANGGNVGDTPSEGTFWTILAQAGAGTPLTGDVTTSGAAATIATGAVNAAKLAVGAVELGTTKVTGTLPVIKGGTGVSTLTNGVNSLLASTTTLASKAALATLGVGTAGFVNTGVVAGCVPLILSGGKLPVLDGSNLTGLAEFEELHPTRLVLNDLSGVAAEAGTLAYNGPNLAKHDGTTVGGVIIAGGSGGGQEGIYEEYAHDNVLTDTGLHEALVFSQQVSFLGLAGGQQALIKLSLNGFADAETDSSNWVYMLSATMGTPVVGRPLFTADILDAGSISRHLLLHTGFSNFTLINGFSLPIIVPPDIILFDVIKITSNFAAGHSSNITALEGKSWVDSTHTSTSYELRQNVTTLSPPAVTVDEGLLSIYFTIINRIAILQGPVYPSVPFDGAIWFNTTTSSLSKFSKDTGGFESYTPSGGLVVQATYVAGTFAAGQVCIALNRKYEYRVGTATIKNFKHDALFSVCNVYFPPV